MRSLLGVLTATELELVKTGVALRFNSSIKLETPEALIIYEQRLMDQEYLKRLCEIEYGHTLEIPKVTYLPEEVIEHFRNYDCVPISMNSVDEEIHVAIIPELSSIIPNFKNYRVVFVKVPIFFYVKQHTLLYGQPKFLLKIPSKDLLDFIIKEAVDSKAIDITISNTATNASVYYNIKKKKVYAKRVISREDIESMVRTITVSAGSPMDMMDRMPKYVGIRLDTHNRGRVVINTTHHGKSVTIRVLPDEMLSTKPEDLNHSESTVRFLKDVFMNDKAGMRILIGPTMSGKNTTILSALLDVLEQDIYKAVSVESPVEILVPNMEQISAETPEEFSNNVMSLIRQNPDLVYISEMTNMTATGTMEVANTGKRLFTSIHANSIAEVFSRIQDLTGLSIDRIVLSMHSAVYQELTLDESGNLRPMTRCVYFDTELKKKLLGKDLGQIYNIIGEEEDKWS